LDKEEMEGPVVLDMRGSYADDGTAIPGRAILTHGDFQFGRMHVIVLSPNAARAFVNNKCCSHSNTVVDDTFVCYGSMPRYRLE